MPASGAPTTLYIIAYDIPQDRRRTKVHRILSGYGQWTQYSLFECWLTRSQLLDLRIKLEKLLEDGEDSIRIYGLCATCQKHVITLGSERPQEPIFLIH